jgi:hypothetical protein
MPQLQAIALCTLYRHHAVIHQLAQLREVGEKVHTWEQGFVTSRLNFVNRKDAYVIAKVAGPLKPRKPGQYQGDELYSEDLW